MRYGIIAFVLLWLVAPAQARHHRHYHHHHYAHHHRHHTIVVGNVAEGLGVGPAHVLKDMNRPKDCYGIPWCGCWLRHQLGVGDKDYNRAVEWRHWGHATQPKVGAVVVWYHHVGLITGGSPGNWIVTSGNDGHAVRSRRRSLAGAIAFREA